MSSNYQVLARKWRPHNFETLVGQDHVVTALTRALSEKRLHHAYLFTGTRGVGKTTISRILRKHSIVKATMVTVISQHILVAFVRRVVRLMKVVIPITLKWTRPRTVP